MKTIKELKDGDILWFVQGTEIKESVVKNFHIKELPVIDGCVKDFKEELEKMI